MDRFGACAAAPSCTAPHARPVAPAEHISAPARLNRISTRHRVAAAVLLLVAAAGSAFAQGTPAAARLTRWDIHAASGGANAPAEGTHKLSDIARDANGNLWVVGQGAGQVRLGRIATANPANVTYTEWKVFKNGEDGEPRGLAVTPAGDVWMGVGGAVPFVRKLAGSNTFLNFRRDGSLTFSPHQMVMAGDESRIFVAGADEAGRGYIVTIAASLGAGADEVALPAWAARPPDKHRFQPEYIAIDPGSPGVVWFTNNLDHPHASSTLARLDVSSGLLLEWPLSGPAAAGLYIDASRVCVVTRGSLAEPPAPAGDVECLVIPADVPSTTANEMATIAATRQRFNRSADGALNLPEQIVGSGSGLFVSEPGGNAVVFIGASASADVVEDYVSPEPLQLVQAPLAGFRIQDDWEGPNQPRLQVPLAATSVTLPGSRIGTNQVRFGIPGEPQQDLETLLRQPHPTAMTAPFFPNGPDGPATLYVTESFHTLRGATYLGGRVDAFELPSAPIISVTDVLGTPVSALSFSANAGAATVPTQQLLISNIGPGSLDWVASAAATGFSLTVSPVTSGIVSGTTAAAITLTPAIPSPPGVFNGTLTISSPSTLDSVIVPLTLTVHGDPLLTADRTELTFRTNRTAAAADVVELANAPYRRAVTWQASGPQWLTVMPGTGSLSGGQHASVTAGVNTAAIPVGVPQTADLIFFDSANPTAANTRVVIPVTVTVTAPKIVLDQSTIAFPAVLQGGRASRAVTLANAGTGPLNPTIAVTPGATWLGASLSGGTPIPAGESRMLTVSVDTFGLSTGAAYTATISVSDPNAADLPLHQIQPAQQITISVEVTPSGEVTLLYDGVPISPTTPIAVEVIKGIDTDVTRNFQVTNTGSGSFEYVATAATQAGGPWLSVGGPASGAVTTTQGSTLTLRLGHFPAPGTYDGQVALTLTSGTAGNAPLTLPVRLTVKGGEFKVSPGAVTHSGRRGQEASASITIENVGDGPLNFSATVSGNLSPGGTPWFVMAPGYGLELGPRNHPKKKTSMVVYFDTGTTGDFTGGRITLTDANTSRSVSIPIELHVAGAPQIAVSGLPLQVFQWNPATGAGEQLIEVRNTGDVILNAQLSSTVPWVRFSWPGGAQSIREQKSRVLGISIEPQFLPGPGIHTGQVTIEDPDAPGVRATFAVTLEVASPAQLVLSPLSLLFETWRGRDAGSQVVTLSNPGSLPLNAVIDVTTADGTAWLVATPSATQVAPKKTATLTVTPLTAALAPGTYSGTIRVRDTAAGVSGQVAVRVTVKGGGLTVLPGQLTFETPRWTLCNGSAAGTNPASQNVVITNDGDRPVWYLVAPSTATGGSWLTVSPNGGVVPSGSSRTVSVSVDAKGLAQGAYTGALTVYTLANASNSYAIDSRTVPIAFNVRPAKARLCVSPASLDFGSLKPNVSSAARTITVYNAGDGQLTWSATAAASNGTVALAKSGSTLAVTVRTGTKTGGQTGQLTVSAPGVASQIVALKWSVTAGSSRDHDEEDCERHERDHGFGHDNGHHDDHDHDRDGRCDHDRDHDYDNDRGRGHDCYHDHDRGDERDHCRGDHDRDGRHDDNDHARHRHGYDRD